MADPVADLSSLENLPDQPRRFSFPQREFGKQSKVKRSFQPSWFDRWTWLHYRADNDSVVCFTCLRAVAHSLKRLQWSSNADQAFLAKGFCNWKNACVKFGSHQASRCHMEAVLKMVSLPATTQDVGESLSSQHQSEKLERRLCFIKIVSSIRFLSQQGLSLRGHGEEVDSNFSQLLKLRAEEDPRIQTWMKKKTNKYTSSDVQNEVLKTMSHHILRKVASSVRLAPFCAIMVDETTDVANKEQVVLCLRWVDSCLAAHEEFMGLYQVDSTEASVLNQVIHDFLTRLNISINKVRGQCYDGAAAMSGSRTGVATRILKEEPRAVFTHCYGYALNLACSDMVKKCRLMKDALDVVYEITKLIKFSPRRDAKLQSLKQQVAMESPGIRVLCPTRWTVRGQALQSIIANYDMLQLLWEESLTFVRETDIKSRIMGVSTYMKSFDFFFGVLLGELLLLHSDNLSKSLQSSTMSAAEGQKVAAMTIKALQSKNTLTFSGPKL